MLMADGVLAVACLYFRASGLLSFYLAVGMLTVVAGLGLLAAYFLLVNLRRRQWHRAWEWLALAATGLGSYWLGASLFLFVVGGHLDVVPPPG